MSVLHIRQYFPIFIKIALFYKFWNFNLRLLILLILILSRIFVGIKSGGWPISRNVTALIRFHHRWDIRVFGISPLPLLAKLRCYPWIQASWWGYAFAFPALFIWSLRWSLFFLLLIILRFLSKYCLCLPQCVAPDIFYEATDLSIQTFIALCPLPNEIIYPTKKISHILA